MQLCVIHHAPMASVSRIIHAAAMKDLKAADALNQVGLWEAIISKHMT